jgi:hypothetical protein
MTITKQDALVSIAQTMMRVWEFEATEASIEDAVSAVNATLNICGGGEEIAAAEELKRRMIPGYGE